MATFKRHENGIGSLEITWIELSIYSQNAHPVCDECLKSLVGQEKVTLIPLLNQAYCPVCGPEVLARMVNYSEDRPYATAKERFWLNYFGLKEVLQ